MRQLIRMPRCQKPSGAVAKNSSADGVLNRTPMTRDEILAIGLVLNTRSFLVEAAAAGQFLTERGRS